MLVQEDAEHAIEAMELEEIGRYFTHFNGSRFVPNAKLATIYPEDAQQPKPSGSNVIKSLLKSVIKQNASLSTRLSQLEKDVKYLKGRYQGFVFQN